MGLIVYIIFAVLAALAIRYVWNKTGFTEKCEKTKSGYNNEPYCIYWTMLWIGSVAWPFAIPGGALFYLVKKLLKMVDKKSKV